MSAHDLQRLNVLRTNSINLYHMHYWMSDILLILEAIYAANYIITFYYCK